MKRLQGIQFFWKIISFISLIAFSSCSSVKKMKIDEDCIKNENFAEQIAQAEEYLVNCNFQGTILVAQNKDIIYAKGFGLSDKNDKESPKNSINTTYEIGSITKQMTGAAIMQLIEKKKLSPDTTIDKFFPNFEHGKNITVGMLINMRSGLYDYINASSDFFPKEIANKIEKQEYNNQPVEKNIVVDYLGQTQTLTTPDTTFFYCNTDYYLLAKILEQVSGMSYKDYMKKYIFSPCGMTHTNCNFQETTAKGYDYKNHYYSFPEDFAIGCGDVNSNVIDLLKWNLQLSEGKVIKKKSYKKIISEKNYSYGLIKNSNSVLHAGNTCVFNSYNVFNHKTKTSIIVLINQPVYKQNSSQIAEKIKNIFSFEY